MTTFTPSRRIISIVCSTWAGDGVMAASGSIFPTLSMGTASAKYALALWNVTTFREV